MDQKQNFVTSGGGGRGRLWSVSVLPGTGRTMRMLFAFGASSTGVRDEMGEVNTFSIVLSGIGSSSATYLFSSLSLLVLVTLCLPGCMWAGTARADLLLLSTCPLVTRALARAHTGAKKRTRPSKGPIVEVAGTALPNVTQVTATIKLPCSPSPGGGCSWALESPGPEG